MTDSPEAPVVRPLEPHSGDCIFVLGSPRSGTSVMAWALAQHDDISTGPEADFTFRLLRQDGIGKIYNQTAKRESGWLASRGVSKDEFLTAVGIGIDHLFRSRQPERFWVDSSPACVLVGQDLLRMYPKARIVHMLRDGRSTVASMTKSGFDVRVASDFEFACQTWVGYASRGRELVEQHPGRCIEVLQQRLKDDAPGEMERVFRFLGLEPAPASVDYLSRGLINSSWGNTEKGDVRKSKPASVAPKRPWSEWTDEQKETFSRVCGETMEALGFDSNLD